MLVDVLEPERKKLEQMIRAAVPGEDLPILTYGPRGFCGFATALAFRYAGGNRQAVRQEALALAKKLDLPDGWKACPQDGYLNLIPKRDMLICLAEKALEVWPPAQDLALPVSDRYFWPLCRARTLERLAHAADRKGKACPGWIWHSLKLPSAQASGHADRWIMQMMDVTQALSGTPLNMAAQAGPEKTACRLASRALALGIERERITGGKEK